MVIRSCWRASVEDGDGGHVDGLMWYKDLGNHVYGEFSMAVIQANSVLEDQSQLESGNLSSSSSGPHGTFVGVYDGHAGPEAASFVNDNLFRNLKVSAFEHGEMNVDVIKRAFLATEEDFLALVRKQWHARPKMASVGSCCLVGVLCDGQMYIANAGDSRAVLGTTAKGKNGVAAIQLSTEHNVNLESVRKELRALHPDDPQIVVMKHSVWRVKGIIQISRSIGDAYLKSSEFNKEPLLPKFRLPESFEKPILSPEPSILIRKIQPEDQFIIFASDGLWEHLSNQEAVDIVQSYPHNGIARRLVKAALQEAAKKREMRYLDLQKVERGVRRHFHDDITVAVVFLDCHSVKNSLRNCPVSIKGGKGISHIAGVS